MNMKKLPKAVTKTADEMRKAGTDEAASKIEAVSLRPRLTKGDARRQSQASAIVERYANFSALGGVIPVPLLNVAGVTVIILRMVKKLCQLYGVPYEQGRARALIVGLAGGAVPTTASAVTTSTLVYFIPGVNLSGAGGFVRHRIVVRPRHRKTLRRAFRDGRIFDGLPCYRSSAIARWASMNMAGAELIESYFSSSVRSEFLAACRSNSC